MDGCRAHTAALCSGLTKPGVRCGSPTGTDKAAVTKRQVWSPSLVVINPTEEAIVVTGGPHTIVGPGERCLLCGECLERGDAYLFVSGLGACGPAHESCVQDLADVPPSLPSGCDLVGDRSVVRVGAGTTDLAP